MQDQESKYNI